MFVATRGTADRSSGPATMARRPSIMPITPAAFDIIKNGSGDLMSVSGVNQMTGEWQIKLLFKNAYPNPPAWKTCVLVVRGARGARQARGARASRKPQGGRGAPHAREGRCVTARHAPTARLSRDGGAPRRARGRD